MHIVVKQAIEELMYLTECRCHPAYKERGLHDPECHHDDRLSVVTLSNHITELEEIISGREELQRGSI